MKAPQTLSIWPLFTDLVFNLMGLFVVLYVIEFIKQKREGLATQAVELVIVLDGSLTMSRHIAALTRSLAGMIEVVAMTLGFSVGLVVYREESVTVQPLTEVSTDNAAGTLANLHEIELQRGGADVAAGIEAGLEMLGEPKPDRRQVLLVCSDVDGFEAEVLQGRPQQEIEDGTIERLEAWAQAEGTDRRVVSLWMGEASRSGFFKRLSEVNEPSVYCEDASRMFYAMCRAALTPGGEP